jgi:Flp pilus assembly protein TadG
MTVWARIFRTKVDSAMGQRRKQRSACGEQGSVILETALSMILLLTFLFGVMETGLALFAYHFISHAARETTRYAIVRGSSCTPVASACPASPNDIKTYATNLGFSGITTSNVTVGYSAYPAGGSCVPSATCNNPGNLVTVTITYNFPFNVPFIPAKTFSMSSTSAMIISQ